jgi:hypothetical protein
VRYERESRDPVRGQARLDDDEENGDGGPASEAKLKDPRTIALSPNGYLYIGTHGDGIRRVTPEGTIGTLKTPKTDHGIHDRVDALAVDRHGAVYYAVSVPSRSRPWCAPTP